MKDLYETIKDRLSNPFIFSFAIAWLIINWPITIGLIWYNSGNIPEYGYSNYGDLITSNSNLENHLFYPMVVAIGYTFLFPLFKLLINLFNAWVTREDEGNVMRISEKAHIPTTEYLKLEKKYNEDIKELSENIANTGLMKAENARLLAENKAVNDRIQETNDNVSKLRSLTDIKMLEGAWFVVDERETVNKYFSWYIDHGRIRDEHSITADYHFTLNSYICNAFERTASIQIKGSKSSNINEIVDLNNLLWSEDLQSLESRTLNAINLYRNKPKGFIEY